MLVGLGKILLGLVILLIGFLLLKNEIKKDKEADEELKSALSDSIKDKIIFNLASTIRPGGRCLSVVIMIIGGLFINQGLWNIFS